jgi:uncharacterized membrane protein YjgN (DUF898 family)
MNDLGPPAFSAASAPHGTVRAHFTGSTPAFRSMMIKGAFLQVITLGIYRFWLTTDIRRFEWANTEVGGESAEYTGTAIELLIGFLIAIALLVPIFVLIALAGLGLGVMGQLSGMAGYVLLAILGQYAYFRARRYRLTRTVFRGVRLHQAGSAWSYAFRSLAWGLLVLLTLGLAYPFAQTSLERYKLSCTYYGELRGAFVGRAFPLFLRGALLWLIAVAPVVLIIVIAATTIDWSAVATALRPGGGDVKSKLEHSEAFKAAMALLMGGFTWFFLTLVVIYPAFHAMMLRWWLNGLRFGEATVSTHLRTSSIYGAYLRYIAWSMLVTMGSAIGLAVVGGIGALIFYAAGVGSTAGSAIGAIAVAIAYIAIAFSAWIVYQVTVRLGIWRIMVDSVEIAGFDAVERVQADLTLPSSALGEGLVDALGAGGM